MAQWILYTILFVSQLFSAYAYANVHGVMMVVKGDVVVLSKDGKSEKAKVGKKVFAGDTITAGADSRAKIVMTDKNVINISPESQFKIEKYEYDAAKDNKQVSLSVEYGKVRANVEQKYDGEKNKFHIKTPTAVAVPCRQQTNFIKRRFGIVVTWDFHTSATVAAQLKSAPKVIGDGLFCHCWLAQCEQAGYTDNCDDYFLHIYLEFPSFNVRLHAIDDAN